MKHPKGPQSFLRLTEAINEYWVSEDRDFGVPTDTELSVTGQPYQRLYAETLDLDRDDALSMGLQVFQIYADARMGSLYWHTTPTIERIKDDGGWFYRMEMKLLVSDNPVVPRLAGEAIQPGRTMSVAAMTGRV